MAAQHPVWKERARRFARVRTMLDTLALTYDPLQVCHDVIAVFLRDWEIPGVMPEEEEAMRCACGQDGQIRCLSGHTWLCDTCYDVGEGWCRDCLSVRAP